MLRPEEISEFNEGRPRPTPTIIIYINKKGNKNMNHLIDIKDLSVEEIDELIEKAKDIMHNKEKYSEKCKSKILATLFFEPSTRTRLSFESAMLGLRRTSFRIFFCC